MPVLTPWLFWSKILLVSLSIVEFFAHFVKWQQKIFFAQRVGECLSIPFICALHGCIDIVAFSHPIAYTENDRMYRDSMEEMIVSDECMSRVEDGKMIRCDRLLRVGQTLQVLCSEKSMVVVVRGIVGDWVFLDKLELRSQRKRITLREMFNLNRN